ncbi:hypothetical protein NEIG_00062 [Nematocida sp. ERTm5]|nr:hypothetical protein NEIG_00062 [Nematocida sp. ERTm5]
MNPFESVKSGYVDTTVLSYFSLVQKKDINTRCKALARIVNDLDKLPIDSVAQCLYDTMPILCKNAQEPVPTHVSEILLSVIKKSSLEIRRSSMCQWMHMFLSSPNKAGYKVIKILSKNQELKPLLTTYNKTATVEMYIKSKIVESASEKTVDICPETIKKAKTAQELCILSKLVKSLEEKGQICAEIKEAVLDTAIASKNISDKWKVFAAIQDGYTVEELIKDCAKVEDNTFLSIVGTEKFRKLVEEYGSILFVQNCEHLPGVLFSVLLDITNDRRLVLKKLLQGNTTGFEHIKLEKKDFPYVNTIGCYNRVNEVLQAHPVRDVRVYGELTFKERIIRADLLGDKIEDISREMISQISIGFLKKESIFEEGVRVLPPFFFKEEEGMGQEEHIYVAAQHPSLTTRRTIDLMFKHKLFIEKILKGLSDELMLYLMDKIEKEPADVIQEVYEMLKGSVKQKYGLRMLSRIYTTTTYTKYDFPEKFVLSGDIEENYLIYLIEKEAVEEDSVYKYIIDDANKNATGTQNVLDECIELEEIMENAEVKQANNAYLFGQAHLKWKKVLLSLGNVNLSGFLQKILQTQTVLPTLENSELIIDKCVYLTGLIGKIANAMIFWKSVQEKQVPALIHRLSARIEEESAECTEEERDLAKSIVSIYIETLLGNEIHADLGIKLPSVTLSNLQNKSRAVLAYLLLRIQRSTGHKALSLTFKEAQNLHYRVLSLSIQNSTALNSIEEIDFSFVCQEDIRHMQAYLEKFPEKAAACIRSDCAWTAGAAAYRSEMYNPILKSIAKHYANSVLNVYSMSKVEEGAIDAEIFYMLFDIPAIQDIKNMNAYEWRLFLAICSEIRSIELLSLISTMVRAECKWLPFLISSESDALDLLGLFAKNFPVLLRIFFKSSRNVRRVQKYFISRVTPNLIREEASRPLQGVEIKVKTIAETHILVVLYKIEESELEVNINFPKDYPLTIPEIKIIRCVGVKKQRLQRLLLRIQMLMAEHCRVGEALVLWKLALDRTIDEIEECGICFFMVDEVSKSFPDTTCAKCSNQFHGICLKTWLKRSKNLCPICREEIAS